MSKVESDYQRSIEALRGFTAALVRAAEAHDAMMRRFAEQVARSMQR